VLSPSGSTDKAEVLSALDPTCSAHWATSAWSTATSRMTIRLSPSGMPQGRGLLLLLFLVTGPATDKLIHQLTGSV
jgi:hypothetical protein